MGYQQWLHLATVSFIILTGQVGWTLGSCTHEGMKTHYTTEGERCKTACDKAGYSYYWCYTRNGWDYCSPTQNTDYEGFKCRADHPCGKHGQDYYWCKREGGKWGKCAPVEPKTVLHKSSNYRSVCIDDCLYDKDYKYYWCNTEKGWDYCSPALDVTYKNEPCRWDHSCDTHGSKYSWCQTKTGYDKCGDIEPCECTYYSTHRRKRDTNNVVLYCTQMDGEKKIVTTFNAEPFFGKVVDDRSLTTEITNLIAQWNNEYLSDGDKTHVTQSKHCYIEQQNFPNEEKVSHKHLKIMLKSTNQEGLITLVSDILVPVNMSVPDRYFRMAFQESFRLRAKITVTRNICKNEEGRE